MKTTLAVLFLLCSFLTGYSQNIFIANSNPGATGGTNVFLGAYSLSDAINAASNGDIIYVVPSSVQYNSAGLFGKSLSIIGGGFNPQPAGQTSIVYNIMNLGNNSRISGLVVDIIDLGGGYSNILIDNCRVGNITQFSGGASSNVIIKNCIIGDITPSTPIYLLPECTNVLISNNIIYASGGGLFFNLNAVTIKNNLLIAVPEVYAFTNVTNCNIQNNIFYGLRLDGVGNFANNDQMNNLSTSSSRPDFDTTNGNTSSNNIESSDPLFASFSLTNSFNFSFDLTLLAGSPAIGTGFGGIDIGVLGGADPFDMSGTSLPVVQNIIAPTSVPQGTNMNVRIQAKGN